MTASSYQVCFPDGTSTVTVDRPHITHALVVDAGSGWSVWGAFGRSVDAEDEAACLTTPTRRAQVVPVTPAHPSPHNRVGGRRA